MKRLKGEYWNGGTEIPVTEQGFLFDDKMIQHPEICKHCHHETLTLTEGPHKGISFVCADIAKHIKEDGMIFYCYRFTPKP